MAHVKFHHPAHLCCVQEAGDTREAFSALKAQFISHHDLLEVKERELVRQDGKVTLPPYSALGQVKEKKRKVYAVGRHDGSLCTQKQPEMGAVYLQGVLAVSWQACATLKKHACGYVSWCSCFGS